MAAVQTAADRARGIAELGGRLKADAAQAVLDAFKEIDAATAELGRIREQLELAADGRPHERVGRMMHADGAKIFSAFSAVERLTTFNRVVAYTEAPGCIA